MALAAHVSSVFRFNNSPPRLPAAIKGTVSACLPMLVLMLLGHGDIGLLASLGAFAVMYAPDTPGRFRFRFLLAVAGGLIVSAALGSLVAREPLVLLIVMVLLAALAAMVCVSLKVGPPGSYFFVLVAGVSSYVVGQGVPATTVVGMTVIGAVTAVIVGMADLAWNPNGPETKAVTAAENALTAFEEARTEAGQVRAGARASAAVHKAWTYFRDAVGDAPLSPSRVELSERITAVQTRYANRAARMTGHHLGLEPTPWGDPEGEDELVEVDSELEANQMRESSLGRPRAGYLWMQSLRWRSESTLIALRVGVAGFLSGLLAYLLEVDHGYWGVIFAALVLHQGGTRVAQTVRGAHRVLGTYVGLGVFALIVIWQPTGLWLLVVIAVCQFTIELLITRNYGAAVVFITPLSLTISSSGPFPVDEWAVMGERALDTFLSVVISLIVLWVVGRGASLRFVRMHGRRVVVAMERVIADLATAAYATTGARRHRRRLYYELLELDRMLTQSLADDVKRVEPYQEMSRATITLGYLVLGACWHPQARQANEVFRQANEALQSIKAHPLSQPRSAADLTADVQSVRQVITNWRQDDPAP